MGPEAAKSFPGTEVTPGGGRAKQQADYGRRGKGYVFGAFVPATGAALTQPYAGRTTANWIDFLGRVERWVPAEVGAVYAILDNLAAHRGTDALLFSLAHPRWEFVFQPTYAAYLNLIEPWWKVLRSLALRGGGSRAGRRSAARSRRRRPTGTSIGTRSSGAGAGGIGRDAGQGLRPYPASDDLPDAPLSG
jgi:hypothetical protein